MYFIDIVSLENKISRAVPNMINTKSVSVYAKNRVGFKKNFKPIRFTDKIAAIKKSQMDNGKIKNCVKIRL